MFKVDFGVRQYYCSLYACLVSEQLMPMPA